MTQRQAFSTNSQFEQLVGYSRAVRQGPFVFCAGCTGYDYAAHEIASDLETQTRQSLENMKQALSLAGAELTDVIRLVLYITDESYFEPAGRIVGETMKGVDFVATGVVAGLVNKDVLVEIEVTALTEEA